MALDGLLLDLDGTLIDSRDANVRAWARAFERRGYVVPHDRLAAAIARGGERLVADVLGHEAEAKYGAAFRRAYEEEFAAAAEFCGIRALPGVVNLVRELHRRGIETALVTRASDDELDVIERATAVRFREIVDVVIGDRDVSQSKLGQDALGAALEKLHMTPAQCALFADSPADARAATRAGLVMLGVTSGGNDARVLRRSGARVIYRDVSDTLAHLDDAIKRASPSSLRLDLATLERLMREALDVAEESVRQHRVPTGAIVVRGDGTIVGRGRDLSETHGPVAHAELEALRVAAPLLSRDSGGILVTTREPCLMCAAAAAECGIDTILFARRDPRGAGTRRLVPGTRSRRALPRALGGILAEEARALHSRFAGSSKDAAPATVRGGRAARM